MKYRCPCERHCSGRKEAREVHTSEAVRLQKEIESLRSIFPEDGVVMFTLRRCARQAKSYAKKAGATKIEKKFLRASKNVKKLRTSSEKNT